MKSGAPKRPARPAMDLDKMMTNFLKDSDEKQTVLNRGVKGSKRRG